MKSEEGDGLGMVQGHGAAEEAGTMMMMGKKCWW